MKNEKHIALLEIRDDIVKKLEHYNPSLTTQLKTILGYIDELTIKHDEPKQKSIEESLFKIESSQATVNKKLKPVEAVRRLLKENPDKKFTPPEIRDYLRDLKEKGELNQSGKNILVTTHTVIRGLLKQRFVTSEKQENGDPIYFLNKYK